MITNEIDLFCCVERREFLSRAPVIHTGDLFFCEIFVPMVTVNRFVFENKNRNEGILVVTLAVRMTTTVRFFSLSSLFAG